MRTSLCVMLATSLPLANDVRAGDMPPCPETRFSRQDEDWSALRDPDPHAKFWGLYAVTPFPLLPGGKADFYYLGLERDAAQFDQGTAREARHSVGTRLWGQHAGWDWNFEFVYQFGEFGDGAISAWTAASDTGFTFTNAAWSPRLGLKADVTSGDRNSNDRDLQTFNPLF